MDSVWKVELSPLLLGFPKAGRAQQPCGYLFLSLAEPLVTPHQPLLTSLSIGR